MSVFRNVFIFKKANSVDCIVFCHFFNFFNIDLKVISQSPTLLCCLLAPWSDRKLMICILFVFIVGRPRLANWNLEQNFSLVSISDSSAIITSEVFHLFNLWRRRKVPRQKVVWNKKFTCVSGKIIDPEKNSKTFYFSLYKINLLD